MLASKDLKLLIQVKEIPVILVALNSEKDSITYPKPWSICIN